MIKKIPVSSLQIGMYIHDLNCSWMKHPFAVNKFMIRTNEQVSDIKSAGIQQVFIDISKGLDFPPPGVVDEPAVADPPVEAESESTPVLANTGPRPLSQELSRAGMVRREATQLIANVMADLRMGRKIEVAKISPVVEGLVASIMANEDALLGLTRIRKAAKYTFEHAVSVSVLLTAFGKHLGFSDEDLVEIGIGGLLHDLGFAKVPMQILSKAALTDSEIAEMRRHVRHGSDLLKEIPGISDIVQQIVTEHHEYLDGSGYPNGAQGDAISFFGQMAAIADAYDILTTERPNAPAIPPNAALRRLMTWGQTKFSQELVQQFIHCVGIYPVGSLVALSDGRFAVVTECSREQLLFPKIRVVFDSVKRKPLSPIDIDLASQPNGGKLKIVSAVEAAKWNICPENYLDHRAVA